MVLPNAEHAIIDRAKLEDTCCPPAIRSDGSKLDSLNAFSADRWEALERAIREQHLTQDAEAGPADAFGQPFTIRAILEVTDGGLGGRRACGSSVPARRVCAL